MQLAKELLVTSIATSVTSIVVTTILSFGFEDRESATRLDTIVAWSPLIVLNWSIFAFIAGLLLWSAGRHDVGGITCLSSFAGALFVVVFWATIHTSYLIIRKNGSTKVEGKRM